MPPVSPIRHGASCTSMRRSYGPAGQSGHEGVQRGRGAVYGAGVDPLELLITNDFLRVLDLLGGFIMGVAAGALASRLNFDAVGFAVVGGGAGLGGGRVRGGGRGDGWPAAAG